MNVNHADLPFDAPEAVYRLGEKVFSRIRDEAGRETVRAFLRQHAPEEGCRICRLACSCSP